MTFLSHELANYDGRPILLYEFRRGNYAVGYVASHADVVTDLLTYKATPITNQGVKQKGTTVTDIFEIECPRSLEVVQWFRYTPPSDTIYLVLRRFHYGDPEAVIVWIGQVVSVSEQSDETASIKCQAVSITLKRGGLRLAWQRGCPHALYDQNCRADKPTFAHPTTISTVGTTFLTLSPSVPTDAYWPGGIVEWQAPGGLYYERRLIEHIVAGNQLYPYGQFDGYTAGMAVTLYPGCKRTSTWCESYFNNLANYGGFPFMPSRSPFDGDPIF